jgi:hypothetical protein
VFYTPVGSSYLADFYIIFYGYNIVNARSNTRYVFKEIAVSFRQVLVSDKRNRNLVSFISKVFNRDEARPTYLNEDY